MNKMSAISQRKNINHYQDKQFDPWECVWCKQRIQPSEPYDLGYGFPIHHACFKRLNYYNCLPVEEILTNTDDENLMLDKSQASLLPSDKENPVHV